MILFLAIINTIIFAPFYIAIVVLQGIIYTPVIFLTHNKTIRQYLINNLIGTDQATNAMCGGDPDETISSRLEKDRKENSFALFMCKFLDIFQKDHTKISLEPDRGDKKVL
jgi:hypothetical protein